ncbi:hypothetical protein SAMN04515675_4212 [Pseudomonas costantinii]|uniref:Uncharacterized protein n=1 Tax=Pseudomonas costantinii TaxID=168469 RepID=A0A1H5GJY7_9PSED|nr:hypothetical protein SAMN04515675_4212 [Pseudomonas costantinii]
MALGGVGSSPQEMAVQQTNEGKKWDGVENAWKDREVTKFNAEAQLAKKISY